MVNDLNQKQRLVFKMIFHEPDSDWMKAWSNGKQAWKPKRMYLASGAYFPVPGTEDIVSKKSESTKSKRSGTKKKTGPSSKVHSHTHNIS